MIRRHGDAQVPVPADPLALPRDRATDQSNEVDRASLGLEEDLTLDLGRQFATVRGRTATRTGRPGLWREGPTVIQERRLDVQPEPSIAPGSIARNIRYPQNAIAAPGFFSWAANAPDLPPPGPAPAALEPSRVDEYYLSSLFLGLPDSAPWVVAGHERPQPGLEPFQSRPGVMGQPGSGWPVVAPEIPSYGSRVPLLRPRTLIGSAN